jgi:hypothetical protein
MMLVQPTGQAENNIETIPSEIEWKYSEFTINALQFVTHWEK